MLLAENENYAQHDLVHDAFCSDFLHLIASVFYG